jgi:hypothetical protein
MDETVRIKDITCPCRAAVLKKTVKSLKGEKEIISLFL